VAKTHQSYKSKWFYIYYHQSNKINVTRNRQSW